MRNRLGFIVSFTTCLALCGCVESTHETAAPAVREHTTVQKKEESRPAAQTGEVKRVEIKKNIFIETQGETRRVLVKAEVCLREGLLEQLLTRKRTKEHEAILAADIDARDLHFALTLSGAEA